jgi:hypothetical protein
MDLRCRTFKRCLAFHILLWTPSRVIHAEGLLRRSALSRRVNSVAPLEKL